MRAAKPARGKSKFEEDMKPPSTHLFSYSTKQDVNELELATVDDVIDLFPGLKRQLRKADRKEALSVVGGVKAEELVIGGAALQIGRETRIGSRVRPGELAPRSLSDACRVGSI